jgi:PAS domain-containing protein
MSNLIEFPALTHCVAKRFIDGTLVHWRTSPAGLNEEMGEEWTIITGQSKEETDMYGWVRVVHPEDRDRLLRAWYSAQINTRPFRCEFRMRTKSGLYVPTVSTAIPAFDCRGDLSHWQGESTIEIEIPHKVYSFGR